MQNWITTVGGLMAAIGLGAAQVPIIPEKYKWIFATIGAIGLAVLGLAAKQVNVHSTIDEVAKATEKKAEEEVQEIAKTGDEAMVAARAKAKLAAKAKEK